MTDHTISLHISDVSAFAKALRKSLNERAAATDPPSTPPALTHLVLLNHIARATGHRNFQALKAEAAQPGAAQTSAQNAVMVPTAQLPIEPINQPLIEKTLRVFDANSKMTRWPTTRAVQRLCTWFMWSRFERRRVYTEREVNAVLETFDGYGGRVVMRREMINDKLFTRKPDGSEYLRLEVKPPPEALEVIRTLGARVEGRET